MRVLPSPRRTPSWLRWSAAGISLLTYLALGLAIGSGGPIGPDAYLLGVLAEVRAPWLDAVVLFVTRLGDGPTLALLSIPVVVLLARASRRSAIFFGASLAGAAGIHRVLKALSARPRPATAPLYDPGGWSFPSGHAMATFCFFASLVLVVRQLRPAWQARAAAGAVLAIAAVGISRVYLGVHYPSDVAGGWAVGAFWVGLLYAWYRRGFVHGPASESPA